MLLWLWTHAKLALTVLIDVVLGSGFGFYKAGFRGAFNVTKLMLRRRPVNRPVDGLAVSSPCVVDGIRMPAFPFMDETLWRETLDR